MFLDTVDLIHQASSNPLLIFCLCNFIIAILFISGFKSDSPSRGPYSCNFKQVAAALPPQQKIQVEEKKDQGCEYQQNCIEDDHDDDDDDDNNDYEDGHDDEDELRKRAEEFIEKINRRWQAEKAQGDLPSWPTAV